MRTLIMVILVVLGLVGVLGLLLGSIAYFSVVHPDNLLPDRCTTSLEFSCLDYGVSDSEFFVELENNMDAPIRIESFTAESDMITLGECSAPGELASSESARISCSTQSRPSDSVRIEATITYAQEGRSFSQQGNIDVFVSSR